MPEHQSGVKVTLAPVVHQVVLIVFGLSCMATSFGYAVDVVPEFIMVQIALATGLLTAMYGLHGRAMGWFEDE